MIDDGDISRLRDIFVTRRECEERTEASERSIAALVADVRECRTKLNMLIGILAAIAVPVLGIAAKLLFGGI
jgi:hypothetical protein